MKTITVSQARANLYKLVDETATLHEPVYITGKRTNAILVSEEDWKSLEETVYLLSIAGMRESLIAGINTPLTECSKALSW